MRPNDKLIRSLVWGPYYVKDINRIEKIQCQVA